MDDVKLGIFSLITVSLVAGITSQACVCNISWCTHAQWTTWSSWSTCSQTCGGGVRQRSANCKYKRYSYSWIYTDTSITKRSSGICGQTCLNGGNYIDGKCKCLQPFTGECCDELPTCQSACQNGGVCIADNTCRCLSNFYGQFCEIGSEIDERLQPHFNPTVSADYSPRSWYDAPLMSTDNKVCYIKIQVQNAYFDTILTAVSTQGDDNSIVFGKFTASPIDSDFKLNHSERFACLKVKCPGVRTDGSPFGVAVDVTVSSPQKRCTVRNDGPKGKFVVMTDYSGGHDALGIELESGNNYGDMYGIYVGTGFRDKAEFLAKQSCYSGNRYIQHSTDPETNVLATMNCN